MTSFVWTLEKMTVMCNFALWMVETLTSPRVVQDQEEEFEDTKGVIRIRKLKQDRQQNGQKKIDKRTNNNLQNITQKTKDRVTRTLLKPGVNSGAPKRVSSSCSISGIRRVNLVTNPVTT